MPEHDTSSRSDMHASNNHQRISKGFRVIERSPVKFAQGR